MSFIIIFGTLSFPIGNTKWTMTLVRLRIVWQFVVKGKRSPYSITERRVPELIPVLCGQSAGDVSHKSGGRLSLLSARPAVTPATLKRAATNFAAWWTEAQWVWTVCLRLLPDSVASAIWTRAFCASVQHANHSATEPPSLFQQKQLFRTSGVQYCVRRQNEQACCVVAYCWLDDAVES